MTSLDNRVSCSERSAQENSKKLTEIEASRAYDSQVCEEFMSKQTAIEDALKNKMTVCPKCRKHMNC